MAKGADIVLNASTMKKIEGIISGTPKPGTIMQVKAATEPVMGRLTYETYAPGVGDGAPRALYILDIDYTQGKTEADAYVSGTRGFLYALRNGDEVNVRKADISGTGSATEDLAIGDRCLVVDGTGMISKVAVGIIASPVSYPFVVQETLTDQPAESLVHCMVSGL